LDKILITEDGSHVIFGSQNLYVTIAHNVKATLQFDLEGQKDVTVEVGNNAYYYGHFATTQTTDSNFKHSIILNGKKSQAHFYGTFLSKAKSTTNIDIIQHHKDSHARSYVSVRAVLQEESQSLYKGLIKIEKDAPYSNAHQENKVLIVSSQAKATSIPSLQILNNEVQCGHGSAISHLDEEQLFYLCSRGVAKDEAKEMIIKAFLVEQEKPTPPEGYESK